MLTLLLDRCCPKCGETKPATHEFWGIDSTRPDLCRAYCRACMALTRKGPRPRLELTGQIFGRYTVIDRATPTRNRVPRWRCRCECGTVRSVVQHGLVSGATRSCGCLARELVGARVLTHGRTHTPEYESWAQMRHRCSNPNHHAFARYGGRGIRVCARWDSFEIFLADMGQRPSPKHSLDRVDNDGNYEPSNCRWATRLQQSRNSSSTRPIEWRGVRRPVSEWAETLGVTPDLLYNRLHAGWTTDRAFTTTPCKPAA
jgi:hypothetical protein